MPNPRSERIRRQSHDNARGRDRRYDTKPVGSRSSRADDDVYANENRGGDYEYDGVVYEPSPGARKAIERGRQPQKRGRGYSYDERQNKRASRISPEERRRQDERRKKLIKSRFAVFYIFLLIAGVAVCLVLFMMAYDTMRSNNPPVTGGVSPTPRTSPAPSFEERENQRATGMISGLDPYADPREVSLTDVGTGRVYRYTVPDAAVLKNRYGTAIAFSELSIGKIVDAVFDGRSMQVSSLMENTQAWEHRNRSNIRVSLENNTLTLGNDVYDFNSQTLVFFKGQPYPIGQISAIDTVTISGYMNKVWLVSVESGHGFLWIENMDKVENGTIAVNRDIYMNLSDLAEPLALSEGTHYVVIEGQNIETYIENIIIEPNRTSSINLIDVELKTATIRVFTNELDFTLIVDGVEVPHGAPVEVSYGEHTIRVEKEGFIPVEQRVEVIGPINEITMAMEKIIKKARMIIYSDPAGVDIYVDGLFIGRATVTLEVEPGTYTIVGTMAGYQRMEMQVIVFEGDNHWQLFMTKETSDTSSTGSSSGVIPP